MGILLTQRSGAIIGNIAKILGFLMNGIYELLSSIGIVNIGLCIIIFTVVIYTLMLPLMIKQQKTTRIMSVMNPEIQAIQKKYENKKDVFVKKVKIKNRLTLILKFLYCFFLLF